MHKSSASFIANLGAAAARKHAGDDDVTPPEPVSGIADRVGELATGVVPGSLDLSSKALSYPAVAGGFMGAGAGAGGVAGGVAGALHGLLSPGEDEEGEERSRLMEALKRALQYGAVGTVAGAAAGPALLPGGLIGGLGAHALTGDYGSDELSSGLEEASSEISKESAYLGRAAARQMHKQAAPPTGAIAASEGLRTLLPPAKPMAESIPSGAAAAAAEAATPPASRMTNPTPTGDLPNYQEQELYALNRPENQAAAPSYRSGSSLKPEIQAGFPPEWFRGRPKDTPPYSEYPTGNEADLREWYHPDGTRREKRLPPFHEGDRPIYPDNSPVLPRSGGLGDDSYWENIRNIRRAARPLSSYGDDIPSLGGGVMRPKEPPQTHDRTGRLLDEPTLQGGSWDDPPRGTGR